MAESTMDTLIRAACQTRLKAVAPSLHAHQATSFTP
jgi:hypothetical protein